MISKRERDQLNDLPAVDPPSDDEADHFYRCPVCGQAVDCRRLGDVLHHEEEGHEPLPRQ